MGGQGTAVLDFGGFPGASDANVVAAAVGMTSTSLAEAWMSPTATADHTSDEHFVETIKLIAGLFVNDIIIIRGVNSSQLTNPEGPTPRIWGTWNVNWVWNG